MYYRRSTSDVLESKQAKWHKTRYAFFILIYSYIIEKKRSKLEDFVDNFENDVSIAGDAAVLTSEEVFGFHFICISLMVLLEMGICIMPLLLLILQTKEILALFNNWDLLCSQFREWSLWLLFVLQIKFTKVGMKNRTNIPDNNFLISCNPAVLHIYVLYSYLQETDNCNCFYYKLNFSFA